MDLQTHVAASGQFGTVFRAVVPSVISAPSNFGHGITFQVTTVLLSTNRVWVSPIATAPLDPWQVIATNIADSPKTNPILS